MKSKASSQPMWRTYYLSKSHNISPSPAPSIRVINVGSNSKHVSSVHANIVSMPCGEMGGGSSSSRINDNLNNFSLVVISAPPPLPPPPDIWNYEKRRDVGSTLIEGGTGVGEVLGDQVGEVDEGEILPCMSASKEEDSEIFVFNVDPSNIDDLKGLGSKSIASPLIRKKKRGRPPLLSGNPKPFKKSKTDIPECFKGFKKPMETY